MAPKRKMELTAEAIDGMNVVELRKELKRMGFKTTGKKDALVLLLKAAIDETDSEKLQEMKSKKSKVEKFFQLSHGCKRDVSTIKELCDVVEELKSSSKSIQKQCSDRMRLQLYKKNKKQIEAEPMVEETPKRYTKDEAEPMVEETPERDTKDEVPRIFNYIHQEPNPYQENYGIDVDYYFIKTYGVLVTTIDQLKDLQPYLDRLLDKLTHDANKYYHKKKTIIIYNDGKILAKYVNTKRKI